MEQTAVLEKYFVQRVAAANFCMFCVDLYWLWRCVLDISLNGPSMALLFACECAMALIYVAGTTARLQLNYHEHKKGTQSNNYIPTLLSFLPAFFCFWGLGAPLENKSAILMHIDLVLEGIRFFLYTMFFATVFMVYSLPLHLIRELYLTTHAFVKRFNEVVAYHKAIRELNAKFPSLTKEEIAGLPERTCIICREDIQHELPALPAPQNNNNLAVNNNRLGMLFNGNKNDVKKMPCGHAFHGKCLRSWFERQQVCPTCRTPLTKDKKPATPVNNNANNADGYPGAVAANLTANQRDVVFNENVQSLRESIASLQAKLDALERQATQQNIQSNNADGSRSASPLAPHAANEGGMNDLRSILRRRYGAALNSSEPLFTDEEIKSAQPKNNDQSKAEESNDEASITHEDYAQQ